MKIIKHGFLVVLFLVSGIASVHADGDAAKEADSEGISYIMPPPKASPFKPEYAKAMELTKPMTEALNKSAPGFVLWKISDYPPKQLAHYPYAANSLPYAVKGDFNGDGIVDVVVAGHDADEVIVALLSSSTLQYYPVTVFRGGCYTSARNHGITLDYKPTTLLVRQAKGTPYYASGGAENAVALPFDAFKTKEIYDCFCYAADAPNYLKCRDVNGAINIRVWNSRKRQFGYAYGGCDEAQDISANDFDYCF